MLGPQHPSSAEWPWRHRPKASRITALSMWPLYSPSRAPRYPHKMGQWPYSCCVVLSQYSLIQKICSVCQTLDWEGKKDLPKLGCCHRQSSDCRAVDVNIHIPERWDWQRQGLCPLLSYGTLFQRVPDLCLQWWPSLLSLASLSILSARRVSTCLLHDPSNSVCP